MWKTKTKTNKTKTMILDAFYISIIAFVYSSILTADGMILERFCSDVCRLPKWIHKPLISCVYCVTGQIAFWRFIYLNFYSINVFNLCVFVSVAIFITHAIVVLNEKFND